MWPVKDRPTVSDLLFCISRSTLVGIIVQIDTWYSAWMWLFFVSAVCLSLIDDPRSGRGFVGSRAIGYKVRAPISSEVLVHRLWASSTVVSNLSTQVSVVQEEAGAELQIYEVKFSWLMETRVDPVSVVSNAVAEKPCPSHTLPCKEDATMQSGPDSRVTSCISSEPCIV